MNTNLHFAIICVAGSLICLIPLITCPRSAVEESILRYNLTSQDNRDSSVASVALTMPLLMDMLTDLFNSFFRRRKYEKIGRNKEALLNSTERIVFLLGTAIVPSITFLPPNTSNWALIYLCCQQSQFVLVGGAIVMSLSRYNKKYWSERSTYFSLSILIIGSSLGSFVNNYLSDEVRPAWTTYLSYASWLLTIFSVFIFFVNSTRWLVVALPQLVGRFQSPMSRNKLMSKNKSSKSEADTSVPSPKNTLFFPVMYVLTSMMASLASVVLAAVTGGNQNFTSTGLYAHNVSFILYLLFITYGSTRMTKYEVVRGLYALIDSKKMYVRYISHELRTPLNSACLGLKLAFDELQSSSDPHNEAVCETLLEVKSACRTAVEILNDLLCFDKLESGILVVHKHEVPVIPFITECVNMFISQAKEAGVTVSMATPHNDLRPSSLLFDSSMSPLQEGDVVHVDKFKMDQVLRNLISNALKFTPRGGSVCVSAAFVPDKGNDIYSAAVQKKSECAPRKFLSYFSLRPVVRGLAGLFPPRFQTRLARPRRIHSDPSGNSESHNLSGRLSDSLSGRAVQSFKYTLAVEAAFKQGLATLSNTGIDKPILADSGPTKSLFAEKPHINSFPPFPSQENLHDTGATSNSSSLNSSRNYSFFQRNKIIKAPDASETVAAPAKKKAKDGDDDRLDMKNNAIMRSTKERRLKDQPSRPSNRDLNSTRSTRNSFGKKEIDGTSTPGPMIPGKLVIVVTDTGAGISAENQLRLFSEIVQFNPEILQAGGGSGLGLWITNSLVHMHNGTVRVHSDGVGKGCTFTVEIKMDRLVTPLAQSRKPSRGRSFASTSSTQSTTRVPYTGEGHSSLRLAFPLEKILDKSELEGNLRTVSLEWLENTTSEKELMQSLKRIPWQGINEDEKDGTTKDSEIPMQSRECGMRLGSVSQDSDSNLGSSIVNPDRYDVLVVDDSSLNRKMLCRIFRTAGHTCEEADDGLAAVERVKAKLNSAEGERKGYDAVLMDFVMPNMDGPTATKIIRELGYLGPIFGVTGNALDSDVDYFLACGADSVLPKPFDFLTFNRLMDDMTLVQEV